jgi:hypothetical protein
MHFASFIHPFISLSSSIHLSLSLSVSLGFTKNIIFVKMLQRIGPIFWPKYVLGPMCFFPVGPECEKMKKEAANPFSVSGGRRRMTSEDANHHSGSGETTPFGLPIDEMAEEPVDTSRALQMTPRGLVARPNKYVDPAFCLVGACVCVCACMRESVCARTYVIRLRVFSPRLTATTTLLDREFTLFETSSIMFVMGVPVIFRFKLSLFTIVTADIALCIDIRSVIASLTPDLGVNFMASVEVFLAVIRVGFDLRGVLMQNQVRPTGVHIMGGWEKEREY